MSKPIPVNVKNYSVITNDLLDVMSSPAGRLHPDFQGNIMASTKKLIGFEQKWMDVEISNGAILEEEIKGKLQAKKEEVDKKINDFIKSCEVVPPGKDSLGAYYQLYLEKFEGMAEQFCAFRKLGRQCYIEHTTYCQKLCSRALEHFRKALNSDFKKAVEEFSVLTGVIAKIAEACSLVSVQPTASQPVATPMGDLFDDFNRQNTEICNNLNAYIAASLAKRAEAKKKLDTSNVVLNEKLEKVEILMAEEKADVEKTDNWMIYQQLVLPKKESIRIETLVTEVHKENIEIYGAKVSLPFDATPAQVNLAENVEKLESGVDKLQMSLQEIKDPEDIKMAAEKIAPSVLNLETTTTQVMRDEAERMSNVSVAMKNNIQKRKKELEDLKKQLESLESQNSKIFQDEIELIEASCNTLELILNQHFVMDVHPEDQSEKIRSFETEKAKIKSELGKEKREKKNNQGTIKTLRHIAEDTAKALQQLEEGVDITVQQSQGIWKEIENDFRHSLKRVHSKFRGAAASVGGNNNENSKSKMRLYQVCDEIIDLSGFSFSVVSPPEDPPYSGITRSASKNSLESSDSGSDILIDQIEGDSSSNALTVTLQLPEGSRSTSPINRGKRRALGPEILQLVQKFEEQEERERRKALYGFDPNAIAGSRRTSEIPQMDMSMLDLGYVVTNIWEEKGEVTIEGDVVKCGTLNQLINYLVKFYPSTESDTGADFQSTFLQTLQTFVKPEQFLAKLIEKYQVPACPAGVDPRPTEIRIGGIIKKWLAQRFDQDFVISEQLITDLLDFIDTRIKLDHPEMADSLKDFVQSCLAKEDFQHLKKLTQMKESILRRAQTALFLESEQPYPHFDSVVHFNITTLAQQMTLIDAELFKAIRLKELSNMNWSTPHKRAKNCPNLSRLIEHSNSVSRWVSYTILSERNLKKRRQIYQNHIILCAMLRKMQNFQGVMSILSGLCSSAITRLKVTLEKISQRATKVLKGIEVEMEATGSFKNYREAIKNSNPPVIPFLGVTLQDLTFIEEGNPDKTVDNQINWEKRTLLNSILSDLVLKQTYCRYSYLEAEIKESFLRRVSRVDAITDGELYTMSLSIEPREAQTNSLTRGGGSPRSSFCFSNSSSSTLSSVGTASSNPSPSPSSTPVATMIRSHTKSLRNLRDTLKDLVRRSEKD